MEKISKEFKMGLDTQKSFAQMHEDRNMNKGIGGQLVKLDPIITHEPREERRTREPQSTFKIRSESYDFTRIFMRTIFTEGRMPLDDRFLQQKTSRN